MRLAAIGVIILVVVVLFAINATDWLQNKVAEDVGALSSSGQPTVISPPVFDVSV